MLNNQNLAILTTRLHVPIAARDAMEGHKEIEADAHYALHDALADMQPDAALLSIALTAKMIAKSYTGTNSGTEVLIMECDRIIDDYGQLWLDNANKKKMDNSYLISILENIPEDLENMAELIEINLSYASYDNPIVAEICDILQIQAGAHALIAEEFLSVMEMAECQKRKTCKSIPADLIAANAADNVVTFPGSARR